MRGRHSFWSISAYILGILVVLALATVVYVVDATERAVVIRFGNIINPDVGPGLHFKVPLIDAVVKYSYAYQTQNFVGDNAVHVLSREGLPVTMDVSIIYKLGAKPGDLYLKFGSKRGLHDWFIATTRGAIRDVIARYSAEELYSEKREQVAADISAELESRLSPYIIVKSVEIRKVVLPDQIVKAIEDKLKAQQEAQRMQYVIQKEKLEMERKKIEAEGIATATEIIAQALDRNPGYIKWYYMKVLEKFAETNNNTIILVPVNGDYYPEVNGQAMTQAGILMNVGR